MLPVCRGYRRADEIGANVPGRAMVSVALKQLVHGVANALFPAKCLGCRRWFHHHAEMPEKGCESGFSTAMAVHFCAHCRGQWTAIGSPLCSRCGMVFESRAGRDHLCGRCLDRSGFFNRARATGIYDSTLKIAIHALKFKGRTSLAAPLGSLLLDTYRHYWRAGDIDIIAPVPLHRRRFRQRGFNQAYLLVRQWGVPAETEMVRDLLARHRATAPQTGLDRRQRRINIKNAFSITRPGQSAGKRVLLVDDVLTTGATAEACAAALIQDGAERVDVLTLARA